MIIVIVFVWSCGRIYGWVHGGVYHGRWGVMIQGGNVDGYDHAWLYAVGNNDGDGIGTGEIGRRDHHLSSW